MTDQPKWTKGPWAVERNKRTWGWVDVVGPSLGVGGPTQATDLTLADEVKRIAEAHLIAAACGRGPAPPPPKRIFTRG